MSQGAVLQQLEEGCVVSVPWRHLWWIHTCRKCVGNSRLTLNVKWWTLVAPIEQCPFTIRLSQGSGKAKSIEQCGKRSRRFFIKLCWISWQNAKFSLYLATPEELHCHRTKWSKQQHFLEWWNHGCIKIKSMKGKSLALASMSNLICRESWTCVKWLSTH